MRWTSDHDKWLIEHDAEFETRSDILAAFNKAFDVSITLRSIDARCRRLGLHRKQGYKPRRDGHNYKSLPLGAEVIRVTGQTRKKIWFVKVSDNLCSGKDKSKAPYNWEKKHLLVWRKANGDIPKGCKVVFLNNDTLDCRLENLYLTTDAVHMMMIKYGWYSENPEITKTALKCCELELLTKKVTNAPDRH